MRLFDIARIAALVSCVAVLSACPKKDTDAAPEPAATPVAPATPAAQTNSDKAGVEPAAPAAAPAKKKADDDKGGW
jgi:hypothetical protein